MRFTVHADRDPINFLETHDGMYANDTINGQMFMQKVEQMTDSLGKHDTKKAKQARELQGEIWFPSDEEL